MTDEGTTTTTPGPSFPGFNRWRRVANALRVAFERSRRTFGDSQTSLLADFKSAFGHFQLAYLVFGLCGLVGFSYFFSGIYSVAPGELAVVRRFGNIVQSRVEPGLHYRLPWPIEGVDIVNVSKIRREQIGILEPEAEHAHPEPPSKLQALSGDTNVVDVEVIVQYRVREPVEYLFNIKYAPYRVVRDSLRAAVTSLVTILPVDALLTTGRQSLQQAIRDETQMRLDRYGSGLDVVGIDLQKVFPPGEVAGAFTAVNTAREEMARTINDAQGYANSLIPEARGEALQIAANAQAYKSETTAEALGTAQAFDTKLIEYQRNSAAYGEDVTRYRLYLDTMEKILPSVRVYALDKRNGGHVNLRLFDELVGIPLAGASQSR